jgi:tripeptide aminopeptidase
MVRLKGVSTSAAFETARAAIHATDDRTLEHQCAASSIAAPSHHEGERGRWFADRLRELDLDPQIDEVGNVIAHTPCAGGETRPVAIVAHLDSVFAADTPLEIRREGTRYCGPGISDNARGLASVLALGRALREAGWPTRHPLALVGSVGEEGAGDLFGVKHYVAQHGESLAAFIALDGAGAARIITAGVGSRRLRVSFQGPGGHSWSDFGAPNAIHACASAIAALTALPLPTEPRTTLSVGRIGGGTSINAIPGEAWFELDLRSEALEPLLRLEAAVRSHIEEARAAHSGAHGAMHADITVFGDRPAGRTPADHPLIAAAVAATRAIGLTPQLASSSTDANVAMAAGIPAIAIGAGGDAGGTHTLREWYDNRGGAAGLERALMVVLEAAGLAD